MSAGTSRDGILLVDKPGGLTSHDVVGRVRRLAGTRRVGHAGTLDPMATGLLVLGIGGSTRLLTFLVGLDKEYRATIRLGASTPTDDADSEPDRRAAPEALAAVTDEAVREGVAALTGHIQQVPSAVSAIKVDGKRSYARVRAGEQVELPAREVTVSRFDLLGLRRGGVPDAEGPDGGFLDLDVEVACSSGTYIRALARDLGERLGVGGHLTALRRTAVGPFGVGAASALEDLDPATDLLAPADVAGALFPRLALTGQQTADLLNGKRPAVEHPDGEPVAALAPDGRLAGLVRVTDGRARAIVNFPGDAPAERDSTKGREA